MKFEKVIEKAIELLDKGKSIPEILNSFPEFEKELKEIFEIIEILGKEKITPNREILERIINQIGIEKGVTKEELTRYLERETKLKGRLSLIELIKSGFNMAEKWKIIVPVGTLIVLAVLIFATQSSKKPTEIAGPTATPVSTGEIARETPVFSQETPPVATGNIDDVVSVVLSDASVEVSQIERDIQEDVNILGIDNQALNDFLGAYNENEF